VDHPIREWDAVFANGVYSRVVRNIYNGGERADVSVGRI
jgi:hypothetical protein